jgi:hypothetical protein
VKTEKLIKIIVDAIIANILGNLTKLVNSFTVCNMNKPKRIKKDSLEKSVADIKIKI